MRYIHITGEPLPYDEAAVDRTMIVLVSVVETWPTTSRLNVALSRSNVALHSVTE